MLSELQYEIPDIPKSRNQQNVRKMIIDWNRKMIMSKFAVPTQVVNFGVTLQMPVLRPLKYEFKEPFRFIPKPNGEGNSLPKFPFYNRTFRFLYMYIGTKNGSRGIWDRFKLAYEEIVPKEHRPLQNMYAPDNTQKLKQNLQSFLRSGMQIRVLIEQDCYPPVQNIIKSFINSQLIVEILIQNRSVIRLQKTRTISNLASEFEKEIKRLIKISTKKNICLQYNFVNLQAKSSEIFHRRNLMYECVKTKELEEHQEVHKKFTEMMKNYENQKMLVEIDKLLENRLAISKLEEINKCKNRIKDIQRIQQEFCQRLSKYLQSQPIECNKNCDKIYFQIIQMYKKQTSIYEVINTNIRLSVSVNETNMKCLSTIIKYLYEAIRYYFLKLRKGFQFKKLYRGCRIKDEEMAELNPGSIVMNLGFMSTSCDESVAKGFLPQDGTGCLLVIQMDIDEIRSDHQDQQGFILTGAVFKDNKIVDKEFGYEQQVLLNSLNIFKVTRKQTKQNHKTLYLKYAPHISLARKIQNREASQAQKQEHAAIKSSISSLTRTSYDRGKLLHLKGEASKALQHYKQVEETKGEILTIEQQFNKIQILNQLKDFDERDKYLNKLIISYQQKVEQINNPQPTTEAQKKQNIQLLATQSQMLQITANYLQAEQCAKKAAEQAEALSKQVLQENKKITMREYIETLKCEIKSALLLSRSKSETNDTEGSLSSSFNGIKMIDEVYSIYGGSALPKINRMVKQIKVDLKCPKLNEIKNFQSIEPSEKDLRQQLKRVKNEKIAIRNMQELPRGINITKNLLEEQKKIFKISDNLQKYLQKQKKVKQRILQIYYPACTQIQQLSGNSPSLKLAKSTLQKLKELFSQLIDYQNQFNSIIKSNLKSSNQDIKAVLENERKILEASMGKFQFKNFKQILDADEGSELNTEKIKKYNGCAEFLLEYIAVNNGAPQKQDEIDGLKKIRGEILQRIQKRINKECSGSNMKLTAEKTLIIESKAQEQKNLCLDSKIIQNQVAKLKTANISKSESPSSIKTISSFKTQESFFSLCSKLKELEKMHEQDPQINKFHFLLKDINDYLELLNNSYSVAESNQQYNKWLVEANAKAEEFAQKYQIIKMNISQALVKHHYLRAQTQLKRGYYRQAGKLLSKSHDMLQNLYERKVGESNPQKHLRESRLNKLKSSTLNKLFARQITIECYRLEAELIGIYFDQKKRKKLLEELIEMKKFVEIHAPNKTITQALINEAVAFVAIRCLPPKPPASKQQKQQLLLNARVCLKESIRLRKGLFGSQNQYLAIGYSHLAYLEHKEGKRKSEENIREHYEMGKDIFNSLDQIIPNKKNENYTYMDKQPILYLYRLELQRIWLKATQNEMEIPQLCLTNLDKFQKNSKDFKSLYTVQNVIKGTDELSKDAKYKQKSEQFLQKCFEEIEGIEAMNKQDGDDASSSAKKNPQLCQMKKKSLESLVKFYDKYGGKSSKVKKYKTQLKEVEKEIQAINPPKKPKSNKPDIFDWLFDHFLACGGKKTSRNSRSISRQPRQ